MAAHASSPRGGTNTTYAKLHDGLDHALALLLKGDDGVPTLGEACAASPFEAWLAVRTIAAERHTSIVNKKAQRAKNKAKRKEEAAAATAAVAPPEPEVRLVAKTVAKVKKEETYKESGTTRNRGAAPPAPVVKMLDLSGSNLSPVMTHVKAPSRKNGVVSPRGVSHSAVSALPPLARDSAESPRSDMLSRLRRLPLLEEVDPLSAKYRHIVKWLESDVGKDKPVTSDLSALINKLQKNGVAVSTNGGTNGKSTTKRLLDLGLETLDERLTREKKLERKKTKVKREIKREAKQRKPTDATSRKRKLGGFVVESDEEEYEDDAQAQDSEGEYQSDGEASSSEEDVDYEAETDPLPEVTESDTEVSNELVETARSRGNAASPRKATPSTSTKASPKSTPHATHPQTVESDQAPLTGREQLASVAARLRQLDQPTYLSYNTPPPDAAIKQEVSHAAPSTAKAPVPLGKEGSSESNAIVLDDSDEDDEDDEETIRDVPAPARATQAAVPASPKPPRAAKSVAPVSPKPAPKQQQRATASKNKSPATSAPQKSAGKGKAAAVTSGKRKNAVESEEEVSEDDGEAEFVAAEEDEDSSTDADDMYDLNEEDVYIVETILEVKKGRTMLNNSGRYTKDPDLFLVKWEGYDDLTWEPEANIPKRIISFFTEREKAKVQCGYQIDKFLQRKVVTNTTTGKEEVLYLIQWKGFPQAYWEVKATLPAKVHVWLEKTSRASLGKAKISGPSPRKKTKA